VQSWYYLTTYKYFIGVLKGVCICTTEVNEDVVVAKRRDPLDHRIIDILQRNLLLSEMRSNYQTKQSSQWQVFPVKLSVQGQAAFQTQNSTLEMVEDIAEQNWSGSAQVVFVVGNGRGHLLAGWPV
jgi:hypothetical protein